MLLVMVLDTFSVAIHQSLPLSPTCRLIADHLIHKCAAAHAANTPEAALIRLMTTHRKT